jgi:hypothetical protein
MKNPHDLQRFVSAGILLFVFFLPLHFHPVAATAQVAKECGVSTDLHRGQPARRRGLTPVLTAQAVASESADWFTFDFRITVSERLLTALYLLKIFTEFNDELRVLLVGDPLTWEV